MTYPFCETIIFTMIFPFVSNKEKVFKVGVWGIIVSGVYLAFSSIINIAIVGENIVNESTFPVLTSINAVNIADFITRFTAAIVVIMVILGVMKVALFYYCAVLGASHLFQKVEKKLFIMPIGLLIFYLSIICAWNLNEHKHEGFEIVPYYLHLPLEIFIPLLLLLTTIIKSRMKKIGSNKLPT
jgi:spore germination protein KB